MAVAFLLGWFGHLAFTYNPQSGLQWRFVAAAQRGDVREVERLFQQGVRIDDEPSHASGAVTEFPALFMAADAGQFNSVEWLLAHGADPNRRAATDTPLSAAEGRLHQATKTVATLKEHGAKEL